MSARSASERRIISSSGQARWLQADRVGAALGIVVVGLARVDARQLGGGDRLLERGDRLPAARPPR